MTRSLWTAWAAIVAVTIGGVAALTVRAEGDAPARRIAYLHVTGQGPSAKAWYDGGPPTGSQVQAALDRFASQGYRFAAIASSGVSPLTTVVTTTTSLSSPTDQGREASYVIVLETP